MKTKDLIKIASATYPEGLIADAYKGRYTGDDLARFIATELGAIDSDWSDKEMIDEAIRLMEQATGQLQNVLSALIESRADLKDNFDTQCIVSVLNSDGEPDFYFVKVRCTQEDISNEIHYDAAKIAAKNDGYEPYLVYDEFDSAGKAMLPLFKWETATVVLKNGLRNSRG